MSDTASSSSSRRPPWYAHLLYGLLAVLVIAALAFNIFQPIKVLPRISLSPGFSFTNQAGERRTSEDYRGGVTLYSFTYTHCGDVCDENLEILAAIREDIDQAELGDLEIAFVTITIDPERDTPQALGKLATQYGADNADMPTWDFLVSDAMHTKYVVGGGFGVYYEADEQTTGNDYQIEYLPAIMLVDGWGIIRAEYRLSTPAPSRVIRDLEFIAREAENSKGVARFAYEAAHLFQCYP